MAITFRRAKEILARYAGSGGLCPTNPQVEAFTKEVLDYMLISGHFGSEHKFCFCAQKGCITLPYELETPLKVKIDNVVGTVWDRWYEFHQTKYLEGCLPADDALREDPNYYPTVYDMPDGGARVGVIGTCDEAEDAHVVVKGLDLSGRQIITDHQGEQVIGEYLSIKKGQLRYTNASFSQITEVYKTKTVGYVTLMWTRPIDGSTGFLADYTPLDETPRYRRFRLTASCWNSRDTNVKVSLLGRIRLKPYYADNDLIPFDNTYTLSLAGQAVNANYNTQPDLAVAKDKQLTELIGRETEHKTIENGQPLEVWRPTSAGSIRNIIQ